MDVVIRLFEEADRSAVVALWHECGLTRPWNSPSADIDRKLADSPEGFFVAVAEAQIVGSIMVGYDGHRGWINYAGVDPAAQRSGIASKLMAHAELWLLEQRCPKVNFQVRSDNLGALQFYDAIGYTVDDVVSMGKRLIADV